MEDKVIKRQSELGIASFTTILLAILFFYLLQDKILFLESSKSYGIFVVYLLFIVLPTATLILGILGLRQPDRKRIFPILGALLSLITLCNFVLLFGSFLY